MNRYTLVDNNTSKKEYWCKSENENKAIQKLGQKEDDDQELGIDSHILFGALKNGVWVVKPYCPLQFSQRVEICDVNCLRCFIKDYDNSFEQNDYVKFKDYGKTWALTEEELK